MVEDGSPEELIGERGRFAALHNKGRERLEELREQSRGDRAVDRCSARS